MRRLADLARRVALSDATVTISGESGVGKGYLARLIHERSPRRDGPFLAISCGAIAETLLDSELFGHVRGAFTGAAEDRAGVFEAAHGGTLLLDEISEVSPAMQVKLLRALAERTIRRVGDSTSRPFDVRILTATSDDLAARVAVGAFRQDLYYRLNVIELHVPPLRERHDDVLPLAHRLLVDTARRMARPIEGFAAAAADQLLRYGWPGNVRELENALARAVALAPGPRIELADLPEEVRRAPPVAAVIEGEVQPLEQVERQYILAALAHNHGNQTRTAAQLQIGAATLYRKLRRYGVLRGRRRPAAIDGS
jgi:DNA-binding NtrC family response regulator